MPSFGQLFVSIGANIDGISKGFDDSEKSLKAFGRNLNKLGGNFTDIGSKLTVGLTLPLIAAGAASVKVAQDFEEAMGTIRAGTGATGANLKALGDSFRVVLASVPQGAGEVATAIADLATRTGLTGQALEKLAKQSLDLSDITGEDLPTQIAATTRVFGDWSIASGTTSEAMDFLFKVSQSTGVGVTKLAETVVQFGAPLRQLGFSFEESAALMGKFEKEGVNLETVMSGLRIGLANFAKAGLEPQQALDGIIAKIAELGPGAEANSLAIKVFGQRAGADLAAAITEGRFAIDDLLGTLRASGETIAQADEETQTLSERFSELGNRAFIAIEPIGTALVGALESALVAIGPLVDLVGSAAQWFGDLPGPVQTAALAVAGIAAAIGPALVALGTLTTSVAGLIPLFTAGGPLAGALAGFGGILAAVTGPVGIAVAVIAGLGIAIYAFRDDIANSRIGEIWSETWANVSTSVTSAFDGLMAAMSNFTTAFAQRWEEGLFGLRPVIEGVWNGIGAIFVGALETISAIVGGGLEIVTGVINVFAQLLAGNFEGAWEAAKGVFRSALSTLVEIVGAQVGAILGIIDGFASALGKNLKLQEVFDKEVAGVLKALDKQTTAVSGAKKPIVELTKSATEFGSAAKKTEKPTADLAKSFKGLGDESKKTKEKLDDLPPPMRFVIRTEEDLERQTDRNREAWERLTDDVLGPLPRKLGTLELAMDDVAFAASRQLSEFNSLTGVLNTHQVTLGDTELASVKLGDAYGALGIKSKAVADTELKALHDALEEIRKQAAEGNPDALAKLSEAEKAYADRVKGAGGPVEATGIFKGALQSVSTAITDLGKDIADRFTEKIKTGIGIVDDFAAAFIRLASEQVIGAAIKGVGQLLDFIPGLKQLSGILFGGGASAAGAAGQVAGAAGAAGQTAGAAGGVAGGVSGAGTAATGALGAASMITGIVTGIVSAVTGVIGVFQNARQENTLNAIEENTRRGTLFLGDRGDQGILGTGFRIAENSDYIVGNTDEMKIALWDIRGILQGFAASGILVASLSAAPQAAAKVSASSFTGAGQSIELASAVSRAIDLSELRTEFEAAQQTANNQLAALHDHSAHLESIQDAIEAQGPSIVINIQNVNGTDQRAAEALMKEVERRLRIVTRGIR